MITIERNMTDTQQNILVFGASGAIGSQLTQYYAQQESVKMIQAFSRTEMKSAHNKIAHYRLNFDDEAAYQDLANLIAPQSIDLIVVATGVLHDEQLKPEKSMRDINLKQLETYFKVNTIYPALIAKYFYKKLRSDKKTVFAALSAKVGSISDNQIGGWYGYRMSKSALNMFIKNLSIELSRSKKQAIVIGLHPGSVRSALSEPYLKNVQHTIYEPFEAASQIAQVLERVNITETGMQLDYRGKIIPA